MNVNIHFSNNLETKLKTNEITIQLKLSQDEINEFQSELASVCETQNSTKLTKLLCSLLNFELTTTSKF